MLDITHKQLNGFLDAPLDLRRQSKVIFDE